MKFIMNNYIWAYSIDIDWDNLIFDDEEFLNDLKELGSIGYEYPHYYNTNKKLYKYRAVIIKKDIFDKEDIERIKQLYWIEPNAVLDCHFFYIEWWEISIIYDTDIDFNYISLDCKRKRFGF